ncbi:uncharacterized protein LOC114880037 isoform X2 [Osmia bicornis bicornis]|nr:uncharacterized protein LOC114880037 isoform X2 [Osmia bicornis bicornis]
MRSTIGVSTINKSSPCFDRTATMWKTLCLLSLTLFTFDFLQASLVVRGEPIRKEGLLLITRQEQSKTDQEETGARAKVREEEEDEKRSELVGKWRNNGEAVEPKWRDGDTVPLLPFPRFSRYSADKIDASEEEMDHVRRPAKYRPNNEQENSLRSRKNGPLFYDYEDYYNGDDDSNNRRGYRERDILSRKTNSRSSTNQEKSVQTRQTNNRRNEQEHNVETVSARYREIFQGRSNDYEQEFNDEEYLKPRPRKRKPPENYEFALVQNETLNEEGRKSKSTAAGGHLLQNAMELKSLLKMQQAEGLSLSEILQQRNFSLNDLLNGKADVIDALKMKDTDESGDYGAEKATKIVSIPIAAPADKAQWPAYPVREPAKTINIQKDDKLIVSIVDSTNRPSLRKQHLYSSNRAETYPTNLQDSTTRKSIATTSEPSGKRTTTSMPLPLATNSMDLLQIAVKLQNSDETKTNAPDDDEIMEFSDFTDYKKGRNGASPVWLMIKDEKDPAESQGKNNHENKGSRGSGSTLSIEKILSPTEPSSKLINNFTLESNRQFVKMDETGDYDTASEREYQNDAPPPIYHHLGHNTEINTFVHEEYETTTGIEFLYSSSETPLNDSEIKENHATITRQDLNREEKKTDDHVASELEPEARAEIFELFASGSAGKRLERLLKSRNMSVEELIALRQRGSSKVHLAEVSRIKVQKLISDQDKSNVKTAPTFGPSTTDRQLITNRQQTYDQTINNHLATSLQNITNCNYSTPNVPMDIIRPKKSKTEEESFSNLRSVSDHDSWLPNSYKDRAEKEDVEEQQHHRTAEIIDLLTTFASMPFVKDIQRDFVREYAEKDEMKLPIENNSENIVFQNNHTVIQSGYVKEIIQEKPDSIGIRTNFDETDTKQTINEKRKTLSNVKPSIIASGAILGLTIVVFLAIFIVCRIRQKQKYRYRNTFSRAVFQAPVLTARKLSNSSSLSTVMVNVVATSTTKRPEKNQTDQPVAEMMDSKSDIDNDSLDANDSWETIPDYMKQ